MSLLQISEPGLSPAPHQRKLAVGIDLGTTHSLVAAVRNGEVEVLLDAKGRALLPSIVRYGENGLQVGFAAGEAAVGDPANTIVSVKRFMGRALSDLSHPGRYPYRFAERTGSIGIRTVAGEVTPVEVSAEILKSLRLRAEAALGGVLFGAVITVPAYFDDAQRQATKDAARLAGITVLRLLNEPTAAAIAYGLDSKPEGIYCVYDLGGGTFDFSVLRLTKGVFEVLATSGDASLGGDDFDQCIYSWLESEYGLPHPGPEAMRRLLTACRSAKEKLAGAPTAEISVFLPGAAPLTVMLTCEKFASLTKPLLEKTFVPMRRALRDADLQLEDIRGVVLVGGATRMIHLREAVKAFFPCDVLTNLDPDKSVALGAAFQANALAGGQGQEETLLLDVIPLSLGLETMGGLVEKIIPRNTTIPAARAQDFTTFKDGQTGMSIHVVQGERELVADCRSLAHLELRGIPPMAAGAARIRVTFQVDADGLLSVSAKEQTTGAESHVTVKPSYGLGTREIMDMLKAGMAEAGHDKQVRALREAQVEARRLMDAVVAALEADGHALLSKSEWDHIQAQVYALGDLLETSDGGSLSALRFSCEALNEGTREFAARRMDASVRTALQGREITGLNL